MTKKNGDIKSFSIIRYLGDPTKATTLDGYEVRREEKIFVNEPGWYVFLPTIPYDNHFVYVDPAHGLGVVGRSKFMCTCGSFACILGYKDYKFGGSDQGGMLGCWYHASYGVHATGESRWI